ncbi:kinesin light chain 3 isoform X2 [Vigna unguiculata]|uniref:kinesin light chain 3 isoform X2 n=1 Tax=Vigna unguiculata TaxID=3917 RepID=UPI0010170B88|nr:kinesin light chain 3 isoform X2 [Vigna unguiculata]
MDCYIWTSITLGISANATFAENATTEASSNNDLGDDLMGLRKIEDGSVVSNIHTAKWRVFTDKAREFFQQGKLDEAEKLFLSAIQEAKEGFGEQDPHVASACNNLAEFYRVKKAFDKAEPLYLEAINILEESFGPDDVRVGVAAHNLGQFYLGQKKLEEARVNYERALKIKRRVLGYGHSECSDTMFHLGVVLYLQGKERDAEVLIKDSIRMLEEGGEGESSVCIRRLRYLSQIYMKSHQVAEAEMIQRKILHILELSKGWNSLATVIAAESLALTLLASGNTKDSKDLLERCLDVRKELLPSDHIQIGANLLHLARVVMLDCSQHKKLDVSKAEAELDMAKNHLHNSIRIARECLRKVSKQKDKLKRNSEPGYSRKEGQAALAILLQSLNTLSSVELEKQELQKIQEGNINLEARDALLQCISAYKEFVSEKSIADTPEIKNEYLSCLKRAQNLFGHKLH